MCHLSPKSRTIPGMIIATLCCIKQNGRFETGETPGMCIRREVQEEAGLVIQNPRLHGLLLFTNFKGNDWYVFVFTATEFTGELIESSPEGRLEWVDDDKLTSLNLWESDHIFFPWIEAGGFFSAKFDYSGDKMLGYGVNFHKPY